MKVVIVGGGIAGLSCGCYLQMNGYETEVLEATSVVGGLCVGWDRGPYLFDGCMRWLIGTDSSSTFSKVWKELGAINGRPVLTYEEFLRVEDRTGRSFSFTSDLDQFARDAKAVSPADSKHIEKLVKAARSCADLDPPLRPIELMSPWAKTKLLAEYLPMLLTVIRWKNTSMADYVKVYRNPFLREVLTSAAGDERMSSLVLVMLLGIRQRNNVGYVAGGSRALSDAIAERYKALGGSIRCRCAVKKIQVEHSRARGVVCSNGEIISADHVVACADGQSVIFKMLEGRYINERLRRLYTRGEVFPSLVQVSLGVRSALNETPESISLPMPEGLLPKQSEEPPRLELSFLGADCGLCPPGRTIVVVRFASPTSFWTKLKKEARAKYNAEKQRLLEGVVRFIDHRFPGTAAMIEHTDIATPATIIRYTGNRDGSCQGWLPTPGVLDRPIPQVLPGLRNFYMAGHWVQAGGGLPPAALSGRYAAQYVCASDKKPFVTIEA